MALTGCDKNCLKLLSSGPASLDGLAEVDAAAFDACLESSTYEWLDGMLEAEGDELVGERSLSGCCAAWQSLFCLRMLCCPGTENTKRLQWRLLPVNACPRDCCENDLAACRVEDLKTL